MLKIYSIFSLLMSCYRNKTIYQALLLAPIILQVLVAVSFIAANYHDGIDAFVVVIGINLIIYLMYCVLIVPFAYAISIGLARKNYLNFFTIIMAACVICFLLLVIGYLIFMGGLPTPFWKLFSNPIFYFVTVFVGVCYWAILLGLKRRDGAVNKVKS